MNQITQEQITRGITKLQEALQILNALLEGIETQEHTINAIEKYTSNSGNTTWKCFDQDNNIIYLRQAHKPMLEEAGIWGSLNNLEFDIRENCDLIIYTIPDGDFLKVVEIASDLTIFVDKNPS